MDKKKIMLQRLEDIAVSLQKSNKAKALLAFGSAGVEIERMDEYSDLDFLVVAEGENRKELIRQLDWLTEVAPIAYCHQNTEDGFKVLFKDGIYCEFGILEEVKLDQIPHGEGRIVWCDENFNQKLIISTKSCEYDNIKVDYELGEMLTNLYVGLCRYARGEKLSAFHFIQSDALEHLLSCSRYIEGEMPCYKDVFQNTRRYERRYPELTKCLPDMLPGYDKSPEAALAILKVAESYFRIDAYIRDQITQLATQIMAKQ